MSQAFEEGLVLRTVEADADLSTKQYYGCKLSSDGQLALCSAAGEAVYGVLQDKPAAAGRAAAVAVGGITRAKAGGVIAPGARVAVDANGKFVTATPAVVDTQAGSATDPVIGSFVVGRARNTSNTADGDIFPLELTFEGAVPTTAA